MKGASGRRTWHCYDALVWGLGLAAVIGCHRRSSDPSQPAPTTYIELPVRHFPGVDVIRKPGGGILIHVVSGAVGRAPLWVVDGTPITVDPNQGVDWLTPEQIDKVEVLKDPDQIAVYGLRGVAGVIVITTKKDR